MLQNKSRFNPDASLESHTNIQEMARYIVHTYDGWYLVALSALYFLWGISRLAMPERHTNVDISIGLLFLPILLTATYLQHHIGCKASDLTPLPYSLISLTAIALAPVYIIFWK